MRVFCQFPLGEIFACSLYSFAHLYTIIWLSVVTVPLWILFASAMLFVPEALLAGVPSSRVKELQCPIQRYIELTCFFSRFFLLCKWFSMRVATSVVHIHRCAVCRGHILNKFHIDVYALLICHFLEVLSPMSDRHLHILFLISGDVETNPGPQQQNCLKFFHWNLNSICARGRIKIPLIEAYNSVHKFDVHWII